MEMVRQADLSLMQYYDEVERRLILVTNKVVMTRDEQAAAILNNEIRNDALHAFIAGLKQPLKAYVLPSQPKDLPSALAMAREAENSIERNILAASYAKAIEDRGQHETTKQGNRQQARINRNQERNPHFTGKKIQKENSSSPKDREGQSNQPQPMEVDPSMSNFRQPTSWGKTQNATGFSETQKRQNTSERVSGQRRQRINNITQSTNYGQQYAETAEAAALEIENDVDSNDGNDTLNF
ncbi:hypothetical protein KR093_010921, partial [Drosophila rubida]